MPNPDKYKADEKPDFMEDCLHTVKKEQGSIKGKKLAPAVGKCLGMWSGKSKKKSASDTLRGLADILGGVPS